MSYPEFSEILVADGHPIRRYLIGSDRHTTEILRLWDPIVDRLFESPGGREHHGFNEMPYFDVALTLSRRLAHPELESYHWLSFYASAKSEEPGYVGLILPRWETEAIDAVAMISAISGNPTPSAELLRDARTECPMLLGAYHLPGIPQPLIREFAAAAGECAAIFSQLVLARLLAR